MGGAVLPLHHAPIFGVGAKRTRDTVTPLSALWNLIILFSFSQLIPR